MPVCSLPGPKRLKAKSASLSTRLKLDALAELLEKAPRSGAIVYSGRMSASCTSWAGWPCRHDSSSVTTAILDCAYGKHGYRGWLISGIDARLPLEPTLVIVKVPPRRSSAVTCLPRLLDLRQERLVKLFVLIASTPRITGTTRRIRLRNGNAWIDTMELFAEDRR